MMLLCPDVHTYLLHGGNKSDGLFALWEQCSHKQDKRKWQAFPPQLGRTGMCFTLRLGEVRVHVFSPLSRLVIHLHIWRKPSKTPMVSSLHLTGDCKRMTCKRMWSKPTHFLCSISMKSRATVLVQWGGCGCVCNAKSSVSIRPLFQEWTQHQALELMLSLLCNRLPRRVIRSLLFIYGQSTREVSLTHAAERNASV